jgi:apolipoprotein N-acyltransferase
LAIRIGLIWLVLTVMFEFGFGHFVAGHSWQRLLQDYNIRAGRVWLAILLWVAFAPYLFFRIR